MSSVQRAHNGTCACVYTAWHGLVLPRKIQILYMKCHTLYEHSALFTLCKERRQNSARCFWHTSESYGKCVFNNDEPTTMTSQTQCCQRKQYPWNGLKWFASHGAVITEIILFGLILAYTFPFRLHLHFKSGTQQIYCNEIHHFDCDATEQHNGSCNSGGSDSAG